VIDLLLFNGKCSAKKYLKNNFKNKIKELKNNIENKKLNIIKDTLNEIIEKVIYNI